MTLPKVIYWVSTALMCLIFAFSAYNYFFNYEMIAGFFGQLGFPVWLIYPLAIAKVLGIIAVLSRVSPLLKEWAYAGFFFDAVLALSAHYIEQDGAWSFAFAAIVFIIVSRLYESKVFKI